MWQASWLHSEAGCARQGMHRDFDQTKVEAHLNAGGPDAHQPATCWISLEDGGVLHLEFGQQVYTLHAQRGDGVVFSQNPMHCGGQSNEEHRRLHLYLDPIELHGQDRWPGDETLVCLQHGAQHRTTMLDDFQHAGNSADIVAQSMHVWI